MKKPFIAVILICGFFLVGCATTSSSLGEKIIISTQDLRREYKALGTVSVKKTSLFAAVSLSDLNKQLRKKAYKQYKEVDAIINVRYTPIVFAQGILDAERGKIAEGTAIKFISKKKTLETPVAVKTKRPKSRLQYIRARPPHNRIDFNPIPRSMVSDWGQPVRLGPPVNTSCPEDAIEISRDGKTLYFSFTKDVLGNLTPDEILSQPNGTYMAKRTGGPGEFNTPVFFNLGKGIDRSLDGELSFTPDGKRVYFHSLRSTNTGYQKSPSVDDFLDIYVADIVDGEPGPGINLGPPVNSIYPEGEQAIHPDGITLYFASSRPGGLGGNDIWTSVWNGSSWGEPVNLGAPINSSRNDMQPAFTSDGNTMYFSSDRESAIGIAIYRSNRVGKTWNNPELVIKGVVGEPSITADGKYLYFVHVLMDNKGIFDVDIWYSEQICTN